MKPQYPQHNNDPANQLSFQQEGSAETRWMQSQILQSLLMEDFKIHCKNCKKILRLGTLELSTCTGWDIFVSRFQEIQRKKRFLMLQVHNLDTLPLEAFHKPHSQDPQEYQYYSPFLPAENLLHSV